MTAGASSPGSGPRLSGRALVLGGSPRSGTTLLQRLVDSHPDIAITRELGCFFGIGRPRWYGPAFVLRMARDRGRLPEPFHVDHARGRMTLANLRLASTVLRHALGPRLRPLDAERATRGLHAAFPTARLVGDKFPRYVDRLDVLVDEPGLDVVMIYRDARDVVSSTLAKARGQWRDQKWAADLRDAGFVARDWVAAVERIERYADRIQVIRYEHLLRDPRSVLAPIAERHGLDPDGFDVAEVSPSSIGNHRGGLTSNELGAVMAAAGPSLGRLGYLSEIP